MIKIFICSLFLASTCFSGQNKYSVEAFEHSNHQYLCFDGKNIIHDPECGCKNIWTGKIVRDGNNEYFFINTGSISLLDD